MAIIAKDNQKEFNPAPEGLHQGVCVDIIDLGLVETQWGSKPMVAIRWQIEEGDPANENKRFQVQNRYNLSLNEKANLRKHLEAWRGRKFTGEELKGFDLEKLIGVNCQLQLVHTLSDNGRTYANVQAIVPIGKTMTKLQPLDYIRVKDRVDTKPEETPKVEEEDENFPF
jgi:hypothetical protein